MLASQALFLYITSLFIDFIRVFDYNQHYITSFSKLFRGLYRKDTGMEYITALEAANKWGISSRRVHTLCAEGRIEGATRLGTVWAIPIDAQKPKDARIKSGKYIKGKD